MASRGVNSATIIGNLGKDPEVKFGQNGSAVCRLTVATSESWVDKATNEKKDQVEWHNVVIFGKLAEIAGQYLQKGSQVYLNGKIKTRKWQDQQGQDRYTTEIVADQMQMLGGGQGGQGGQQQRQQPQQQHQAPQQQRQQQGGYQQQPQQRQGYQQQQQQAYDDQMIEFDSDLPF